MSHSNDALLGKRVIVVGGGGLLGSLICHSLVSAGATIAVADISRERAESTADDILKEHGRRPEIAEVSIVELESVDAMITTCENSFGGIDALVNAAYPRNRNYGRKFEEVAYVDFCENINMHLGGYFLVSQRILGYFKRKGKGGNLVNMSSIYGITAPRFEIYQGTTMTMPVEYAAIKAGLIHLTKYMAKLYAGNNIRVNCLSLGGLLDNQPRSFVERYRGYCLDKGMLEPSDIVGAVVFLLSDASRFFNGQNLIVDDGFTL